MQPSPKSESATLSELLDWLKEWKVKWEAARQLESCDPRELDRIMAEYALTLSDLQRARGCASEQAELLAAMMEALRIDRQAVGASLPVIMRDLQRVCLWCDYKGKCRRDLELGRVLENAPSYCSNRLTLELLSTSSPVAHE